MIQLQSRVECVVVPFRPRCQAIWSLSARDRLDLARWQDRIQASGHRSVVYEREAGDSPEVGSFLSLYRNGEPWAAWSVARQGETLSVWCGRTCHDLGRYSSMREVLQALLAGRGIDLDGCESAARGQLIPLCRVS